MNIIVIGNSVGIRIRPPRNNRRERHFCEVIANELESEGVKILGTTTEAIDLAEDRDRFSETLKKLNIKQPKNGFAKNINEAVKAAVATEIIHAFLLIHDDIIDNDDLRRGNSTMHISLAKKYGKGYGSSLAIIAGDIGFCLALEALQNTSFDEKRKMRVLEVLVPMVKKTCYGEYLDVLAEINDVDEDYIRKIHQNKTAYYTMAGPMKMGALLAGASKQKLNDLNKIGIKLGLAFQLRDDILGVFGDEKLLGKPVASDLIEGKKTLLIVKANSSYINNKIGNKLSIKEIDKIRDIIVKSGSLEYSQELIESLLEAAKKDINKITLRKKEKELLLYLVNYLGKRRS